MRHERLDAFAMTAMVALCAIWGLNQVAAKVAGAGISPLMQAGVRSLGAAVLLYGWSVARGIPIFRRDGTLFAGLVAGAMFAGEFALMYGGLQYTTASRAVVFFYTAPFVVAIGLHVLVPSERLVRIQVIGLVAAFIGIVIAFGGVLTAPSGKMWVGDLMLLGGAALWGGTTVVVRATALARTPAAKTLLYQLVLSGVVLTALSLLLGEAGFTNPTPLVWASLAWQTAGIAFASYLAWFHLVAHYPATRLSAFTFLTPLFGTVFGMLLLHEEVGLGLWIAMALVALGIRLVNSR